MTCKKVLKYFLMNIFCAKYAKLLMPLTKTAKIQNFR